MELQALLDSARTLYPFDQPVAKAGRIEVDSIDDDSRKVDGRSILVVNELSRPYLNSNAARAAALWLLEENDRVLAAEHPALVVSDLHAAAGALASALSGHPSQKLNLVAVTGTNGKTTVTQMLYFLWRRLDRYAGVIGTLGARWFGRHGEVQRKTGYTTPRAPHGNALLAEMLADGVEYVALEASSEAITLGRCHGLQFAALGFSNLSPDHLDFHQTMEQYYQAKRLLFFLPGAAAAKLSLCDSDEWCRRLRGELVDSGRKVQWIATPYSGALQAPARFNQWNAALALDLALLAPADTEKAQAALATFHGAPGRLEILRDPADPDLFAVVDYAHSPDALEKALLAVAELGAQRIGVAFGCGGNRDRSKRPLMGSIAARLADVVIVCDDNPRREDPESIRAEILAGLEATSVSLRRAGYGAVEEIGDRRAAIARGLELLRSDPQRPAALLVAGKGHEDYQILGDRTVSFSDRETVRELLAAGAAGSEPKRPAPDLTADSI